MNSPERQGRCRLGLTPPLLFTPVILVTALLVVWLAWLPTAQAQSWVSKEGGGVRHIVVTLNKSRTLRFDNLDRHSQPAGEDSLHERRKQELFKVRGRSPSPILFGFALHGRRCRILDLDPMARAARTVARVLALRNDAFAAE